MTKHTFFAVFCFLSSSSIAHSAVVDMTELNSNTPAGTITITSTEYGTVFTPELSNLPSGLHGFHIHTNSSCESATINNKKILGGAAGGHYDPENTGKHGFPWTSNNHLGDLPALYVDHHGMANQPVIAPRIKLSDLKGRSIMIHAGGDNHSDHPAALGGGGARLVCGVIK
ncbi:superoxide dismutase family protein [Aliivibrio sp. S4TY2]|uniref:superoxide dismutase family protein n=1 Tax=unclassified Aliivibrio TaxID=2645654 RepID=UPI002378B91C|nr:MULTISPECIES: superoxide dismutase family protein [unclassified Aliivibrio]MDD9154993.1 superoxide dismutase family protein [Aliivibrio sp. S4TY2]MDD9158644.1 superoxide dismutase family protein [Aliivibrio sp. S4TY1]MDD9162996.1 superoxide dismutase family protein [Aliivibrio sp. S4MY2]MDD9166643.1 superoxide dismutase family protein [Aliivibrio sp. S4MY4]MDD9184073.1 superoxide dismutase family protein [Aliivibrio sp. S4MY3]